MCNSFHISYFHVCWSVVTRGRGCVFSAVLSNSCQEITLANFRYTSLKSWKIDNIDLTRQFSLSIFTNFRYQSLKITWLLPIFIDTDFYRLTTLGPLQDIAILMYRVKYGMAPRCVSELFRIKSTHQRLRNCDLNYPALIQWPTGGIRCVTKDLLFGRRSIGS